MRPCTGRFPRHSRRCSRWPAEELKTPVIYGVRPVDSAYAGNQNMVALITSVVRSRDVIAGLHLDHSLTFDKVVECIRDGYTSVMFDGSTLPLEQNLQFTRDVVRVARLAGERRGRGRHHRHYGGVRRRDREPAPRRPGGDTARSAPPARFALHMSSATGATAAKASLDWTRVFSVVPHDLGDRPRVILR
jgi:hypothetical protein